MKAGLLVDFGVKLTAYSNEKKDARTRYRFVRSTYVLGVIQLDSSFSNDYFVDQPPAISGASALAPTLLYKYDFDNGKENC